MDKLKRLLFSSYKWQIYYMWLQFEIIIKITVGKRRKQTFIIYQAYTSVIYMSRNYIYSIPFNLHNGFELDDTFLVFSDEYTRAQRI